MSIGSDTTPPPVTDDLTPDEQAAAAAGTMAYSAEHPPKPQRHVPRWAIHRRLYDWVLSFAHRKHSTTALAVLSFTESSFFPIPPDVLLMPMCLGHRAKAFWFALVCTVAGVAGGVLGYAIGFFAWEATQNFWFTYVPKFTPDDFARVTELYREWGVWIVFAAAFTPIPYKVFTIAGGVFAMNLPLFIVASFIGRGLRFFMVAGLMWAFGSRIVPFIDKYFNLLTFLFVILLIGGFFAIRLLR